MFPKYLKNQRNPSIVIFAFCRASQSIRLRIVVSAKSGAGTDKRTVTSSKRVEGARSVPSERNSIKLTIVLYEEYFLPITSPRFHSLFQSLSELPRMPAT